MGEKSGHPFRGNQFTSSKGGGKSGGSRGQSRYENKLTETNRGKEYMPGFHGNKHGAPTPDRLTRKERADEMKQKAAGRGTPDRLERAAELREIRKAHREQAEIDAVKEANRTFIPSKRERTHEAKYGTIGPGGATSKTPGPAMIASRKATIAKINKLSHAHPDIQKLAKPSDTPAILKRAEALRTGAGMKGMDSYGLLPERALSRARIEVGMGNLVRDLRKAKRGR